MKELLHGCSAVTGSLSCSLGLAESTEGIQAAEAQHAGYLALIIIDLRWPF